MESSYQAPVDLILLKVISTVKAVSNGVTVLVDRVEGRSMGLIQWEQRRTGST